MRRSFARPSARPRALSAVLEIEVLGALFPDSLSREQVQRLCAAAVASAGVDSGHLAVEFVSAARIAELNAAHRRKEGPTDVLSFPIDGAGPLDGTASPSEAESTGGTRRELGDIVVCPEHTTDVREAIVHGALHLVGMDHETDEGEMLALQAELLSSP
jgi:probable rRNA maturation factor